jgi:hypothetical protein
MLAPPSPLVPKIVKNCYRARAARSDDLPVNPRLATLPVRSAPTRRAGTPADLRPRPVGRIYVEPEERRQLVLDLVRSERPTAEFAREHGLPPSLVERWLDEFLDDLVRILAD